jgi:hypothetical protein
MIRRSITRVLVPALGLTLFAASSIPIQPVDASGWRALATDARGAIWYGTGSTRGKAVDRAQQYCTNQSYNPLTCHIVWATQV